MMRKLEQEIVLDCVSLILAPVIRDLQGLYVRRILLEYFMPCLYTVSVPPCPSSLRYNNKLYVVIPPRELGRG